MARVPIKWNGSELTGITLDENGLAAMMTPPPMKAGVYNDSAIENGISMLTQAGEFKVDKRSFTLTINCCGVDESEWLSNYNGLCNILKRGRFTIQADGCTDAMDVIYESCNSFSQYHRGIGKFSLKLTQLNPVPNTSASNTEEE